MNATTVAVDLAKDVFERAVANRARRIVDRKRLTRGTSSDSPVPVKSVEQQALQALHRVRTQSSVISAPGLE